MALLQELISKFPTYHVVCEIESRRLRLDKSDLLSEAEYLRNWYPSVHVDHDCNEIVLGEK